MVEMTIESVRVSLMNYQRVVILKERDANRYLPIWIGPAEADAIAVQLQEVAVPRPLTHDLLNSVISALGAAVRSIVVNDLNNDTFFARILLDVDGRSLEIDSRPSDALALAVRVQVPIFAEDAVLEKAGVVMDPETGKFQAKMPEAGAQVDEEEIKRLSAFTDFINSLDLDDFEQRKT
ncbi:MAG: bifunctional nuclease family protein [Chloroflexi bacterium]|nr:bifunctional nuclease family protein [Chloroflexota bacterium]